MNILKAFDNALVQKETKSGYRADGDQKSYDAYMDNESWEAFKAEMAPAHRKQFESGGGKELEEKDGKPPKMASFASSSRMIYKLSRENPDFVFEKKLSTTVGGMANLDGYLDRPDKRIYVEAKCRKPYGHKSGQIIKQNYREIYEYLQEKMGGNFSCVMDTIPDTESSKNRMKVEFFCSGRAVAYFDIKQMICHLLAVATDALKHPHYKKILFLYLLYNPCDLQLPQDAREIILDIYDQTTRAADGYDFCAMFGHIVDYLIGKNHLRAEQDYAAQLKASFCFVLCDQNTYPSQLF